ncbi:hypothetical protein T4E_2288 [Trichinella pseudospiralis]|uniref:Uncharacterized protein n=1 Tax=Trichinella pseudospiralis TaxID=6337 RepID=A0A0V0XWR3_TRIPS|nr:hypothetical protein T4E_2288 [Trichinella pseudospiralis]
MKEGKFTAKPFDIMTVRMQLGLRKETLNNSKSAIDRPQRSIEVFSVGVTPQALQAQLGYKITKMYAFCDWFSSFEE